MSTQLAHLEKRGFQDWFQRIQLSSQHRSRIYYTLTLLLANNVLLVEALEHMYLVESDDGRKPQRPAAAMLYECRQMVSEGHSFATAISGWVSKQEAALIAAGERTGNLREAFEDAIGLLKAQRLIVGTVVKESIYPIALGATLCVLFYIIATVLVPSLSSAAPPETWVGSAKIIYLISQFVTGYGVPSIVAGVAAVTATILSFPRLRGSLRYRLDKLPPWSVYRMVTGAVLLRTVAVLLRNGVKLHDALLLLSDNANPYIRERVDAAIVGTTKGLNFGEALAAAEFDYPDREAVKYIALLASKDGFDRALVAYSEAWIETSVTRVTAAMKVLTTAALITTAACSLLVIDAGNALTTTIQQNANRSAH